MPSDDLICGVADRIKLDADRFQFFDLLLQRIKSLLRKHRIHSSVNLEATGPLFASLPCLLNAAPAILERVNRGDVMTCEVVIALDEQHICSFRKRPVACVVLMWKPISYWG